MGLFYTLLTHALILATIIYIGYSVGALIYESRPRVQQILLSVSAAVGFLIYMGAKGIGASIPDLMIKALMTNRPITYGVLGAVIPGIAGFLTAWFVNSQITKRSEVGMRWLITFTVLMIAMFTDLYVSASFSNQKPEGFNSLLTPNIVFTTTVGIYLISKLKSSDLTAMIEKIKSSDN